MVAPGALLAVCVPLTYREQLWQVVVPVVELAVPAVVVVESLVPEVLVPHCRRRRRRRRRNNQ